MTNNIQEILDQAEKGLKNFEKVCQKELSFNDSNYLWRVQTALENIIFVSKKYIEKNNEVLESLK